MAIAIANACVSNGFVMHACIDIHIISWAWVLVDLYPVWLLSNLDPSKIYQASKKTCPDRIVQCWNFWWLKINKQIMTVDFTFYSISHSISDSWMWICKSHKCEFVKTFQNTFSIVFQIQCKPLDDIKNIFFLEFKMWKFFVKMVLL